MLALPKKFEERMTELLGEDFDKFKEELVSFSPTKAFFTKRSLGFDVEKSFSCKKVPYFDGGFYFDTENIGKSALHHAGGIYVQDPSAMATVGAVCDREFCNILDVCASPGGKTLGALRFAKDGGIIVSNEYVASRCKTLVGNIERFGTKNAIVTNFDMTKKNELCEIYDGFFDLVICDAPCSGEGMFRKYPEQAIGEWSEENVRICQERQKQILDNACVTVKHGGYLLYSTCTFSLEENEMQADDFLTRHEDFELIEVNPKVIQNTLGGFIFPNCRHESVKLTRRFYPHISPGEGQFIALFKRVGNENAQSSKGKKSAKGTNVLKNPTKEDLKIISEFTSKNLSHFDLSKVKKYNENFIYLDFDANIPQSKVFSCGVKLGEIIKGRFQPHHHFFKCFGENFKSKLELCDSDERVEKYLHGEVLECDGIANGYCVIKYANLILGGGKCTDGIIKNHYPKGLRTL